MPRKADGLRQRLGDAVDEVVVLKPGTRLRLTDYETWNAIVGRGVERPVRLTQTADQT